MPEPLRRFITSQRENRINMVFATPYIKRLWFTIRDSMTYHVHVVLRCLRPDTLVFANSSPKTIAEFVGGEHVLSVGGLSQAAGRVDSHFVGDMLKVTPYYTNIPTTVTPDHKIAVLSKGFWHKYDGKNLKPWARLPRNVMGLIEWKRADQLEIHRPIRNERGACIPKCDYLIIPRDRTIVDIPEIDFGGYHQLVRNGNYKVDTDAVWSLSETLSAAEIARRMHVKYTTVANNLSRWRRFGYPEVHQPAARPIHIVPVNGDLMRLIGYYLAEGWLFSGAVGWVFNRNEMKYARDIKDIIFRLLGLSAKISRRGNTIIIIAGNAWLNGFLAEECGKGASKKHLPEWSLHLPFEKQMELVKGYFRGDGCGGGHSWSALTVSLSMAYQMKFILDRLGIVNSLLKVGEEREGRILGRKVKLKRTWVINITGESLAAFAHIMGEEHQFVGKRRRTYQVAHITEDAILIPIRKVDREWYDGPVCDLTVPTGGSFVTTNMLVHNCFRHVHGFIYQRNGIEPEFMDLFGAFTLPSPQVQLQNPNLTEKDREDLQYLISEIARYHKEYKTPYTMESQEDLYTEYHEGGMTAKWARGFSDWWATHSKEGQKVRKGFVPIWANEQGLTGLTNAKINEIWDNFMYLQMAEEAEEEDPERQPRPKGRNRK
jgi:hypothetical protein